MSNTRCIANGMKSVDPDVSYYNGFDITDDGLIYHCVPSKINTTGANTGAGLLTLPN